MRIVILAHALRVSGGMSVGKNIVATLPKIAPQHEYLITVPSGLGYQTHDGKKNVSVIEIEPMRLYKRFYFDLLVLPKLAKRFNPDVILGLGNMGIINPICKQTIYIQKPHLFYPLKYFSRKFSFVLMRTVLKKWLIKIHLKHCLKNTQLVFCQTPIVQKRFSNVFKYPLKQTSLFSLAVSEFAKKNKSGAGTPKVLKDNNYFTLFFLTRYYPHKNIEILLDIFKNHGEKLKNVRCIVTLAENQHPHVARFLRKIEEYNLQEHILNVGPLEQNKIADYYYNADALFFPTLLETFGIPQLEAMYFGLPILVSDLDFARYICDDAAVYFDPWNPEDIVEKILLVKNSPQLREELIKKGKKRSSTFYKSWEDILSDVMNEIELLVNQD